MNYKTSEFLKGDFLHVRLFQFFFLNEGHNEPRSAEEIAQALSQHSLGHAPEQATEQATDGLNENSGLAAYQEISTDVLNEGPPSEAQSRPGTSRRNKSDRLPASIPAARCSWSKDENAYSELGNFSIQTEKKGKVVFTAIKGTVV